MEREHAAPARQARSGVPPTRRARCRPASAGSDRLALRVARSGSPPPRRSCSRPWSACAIVPARHADAPPRRTGAQRDRRPRRCGAVDRDRAAAGRRALREGDQGPRADREREQSELDPRTAATLQKNLAVIDQAISESRAAVRAQPASEPAQQSLIDGLQDEDRRCCRTPWRSSTKCAKATRPERRGSSPASNKRAPDMRLTAPFVIAGARPRGGARRGPGRRAPDRGARRRVARGAGASSRAPTRGATTAPSRPSASRAR